MTISTRTLKLLIIFITLLSCVAVMFVEPISQDTAYHQFADERTLMMIPNFWNVVSNLGFLIVGGGGLYRLWFTHSLHLVTAVKTSYIVFFAGVSLVAFGSAYYHWLPSNATLLWDRLPMTLAFMALMSFSLAEFLSITWGRVVLWPLVLIGVVSVAYWYWGELRGFGDLRLYALVQFLPMILLVILFTFGDRVFKDNSGYWWLLLAYLLAKVAEQLDTQIDQWTSSLMAGHALKHMFSAFGLWVLLRCFAKRTETMSKTHG